MFTLTFRKKKIFFKKFMTKNIKFIYEKKPTGTAGVFLKTGIYFINM